METFKIDVDEHILQDIKNNKNIIIDYCCSKGDFIVNAFEKDLLTIKNIKYIKLKDSENIEFLKKTIKNRRTISRLGQYHFQNDLIHFFDTIVEKYPTLASYQIIGKSVEQRDLLVMKIGNNKVENKGSIMFIGNIHGNETIGREICLYFINHLCENYNTYYIRHLIDHLNIYIMPSANPDGFETFYNNNWNPIRTNRNNIDLNRDFPDQYIEQDNIIENREPETQSIMKFYNDNEIHLSLTIHSGEIVANYPFDGPKSHVYSKTKDDEFFRFLSYEYSRYNNLFKYSPFKNGITNGAEWYALFGGLQDWRYVYNKGYEITLELSKEKIVEEKNLNNYWLLNKRSLLRMLEIATTGIRILNIGDETIQIMKKDSKQVFEYKGSFMNLIPGYYQVNFKNKMYNIFLENSTIVTLEYKDDVLIFNKKIEFSRKRNVKRFGFNFSYLY